MLTDRYKMFCDLQHQNFKRMKKLSNKFYTVLCTVWKKIKIHIIKRNMQETELQLLLQEIGYREYERQMKVYQDTLNELNGA